MTNNEKNIGIDIELLDQRIARLESMLDVRNDRCPMPPVKPPKKPSTFVDDGRVETATAFLDFYVKVLGKHEKWVGRDSVIEVLNGLGGLLKSSVKNGD